MARSLLVQAGFEGEKLDTMSAIEYFECIDPELSSCLCHPELPPRRGLHYYDAIGDTNKVDSKWRPSAGGGQVRGLWHPEGDWPAADKMRVFPDHPSAQGNSNHLLDPLYNAKACFALQAKYGWGIWSVYKPDTTAFKDKLGVDFELHRGHKRAHLWSITAPVPM